MLVSLAFKLISYLNRVRYYASAWGRVLTCGERADEPSDSSIGGEALECLSYHWLLEKCRALWSDLRLKTVPT